MTDTREPDEPDTDQRDERLAALLAVPPLDAVTRRRLVREALDRPLPRPSRMAAALSIAAAIAVGIVVGVVLVHGHEQVATTTAQGRPSAAGKSQALEAAPRGADSGTSGTPVTPLGDLGDVTAPDDLRAAIDSAFLKAAGPTEQVTGYQCGASPPETFNLVATTALGLGTFRGFPVTVFVGTAPDGRSLAVVVRQDDCAEVASVELPPG
jgi:hypothetical protein